MWRKSIDPMLKDHLNAQVKETLKNRGALEEAKHKSQAQIWLAIANLSKQIFELQMRVRVVENAVRDMIAEKKKKESDIDPAEELRKIMKNM